VVGKARQSTIPATSLFKSVRIAPLILLLLALVSSAAEVQAQAGVLVRVWQSQDGLPGNVVRSLVQASDGYLWVATAEGVARFDGFEFESIEPEENLRRNRFAFSRLFASSGGRVWAATYQGGLFRSSKGRLCRILDDIKSPTPPVVTQLIEGSDGTIFFKRGSEISEIAASGLVSLVEPSQELMANFEADLKKQMTGGRVANAAGELVLNDRFGRVWKGGGSGGSGGLTVAGDGESAIPVELPQIGLFYGINELLEDKEGNVWIASHVNGLIRVRQARVDRIDTNQGQRERAVSALIEDHAGDWWIANIRGGVNRWQPEQSGHSEHFNLSYQRAAAALFEDRALRLWAATRDGSVFCLSEGVFKPQFSATQVPSKVRSITQDADGTLWFGGSKGLISYTGETVRRMGKADGVGDLDFTILQPFPGGGILAGTSAGVMLLGDARGFHTIASPEILQHQWVSGILSISATETWVSTLGGGLYLWDGQQWYRFDAKDGLPDSRLTCVLDDGKGYIWMGSLGGIIRAERKELLAHLRAPNAAVQWLRLDHTDGLPSRECVGGFQPAGWRAKDGLLWFPTGSGIARVRPSLVSPSGVPPPVYLKRVTANGVLHADGTGLVQTDPGRARLEFHFVGLSLSAPEKITYRARLAGLDDSWREFGTQRVASFEAVPPGKYTFEVMAVNGDGLSSLIPARIKVVIDPHFWESEWFYLSVGALVLSTAMGTGWLAARMRMKTRIQALKVQHAREGERSRIARDLHDDLGASLTEISILAALAAEDAEKSPLKIPLDQLSLKAKQVVGNLDEIVWAVNPREDTLHSLIDYLAAFAREFLDIARIPLRLDIIRNIPELPLATTQRHSVFLAAREALNNIVKHAGATEVTLRFTLTEELLEIRIVDNGCGFEPDEALAGNGVGNLKQRMQEAGGDCRIETYRARGTTVFLTLPLPVSTKRLSLSHVDSQNLHH
jgi:signal transduction histidine kinase/ligand-binding sensor domain-containing protein